MNYKNIRIKFLILYSTVLLIILVTFAVSIAELFDKTIYDNIEELEDLFYTLIPVLILIFILVGWFILNNVLKRVQNVIAEVNNIDINDLTKRIQLNNSNDEIDQLIVTFNSMLDRLEDSFLRIKQFSHDVSHELKTPLTVIMGEIELGLRKDRTKEEYIDILNNSLQEAKQVQGIIDSLLFLSNSNQKDIQSRFETVQLDELLIDVISENKILTKEKNIAIEFKILNSTICKGHPLLLKILLGNIFQNSIKYSNKDSKIVINLKDDILSIKDYGIGIKDEDLPFLFDRFYRVDKVRGRSGYGLGLSIVKNISDLHNFKIDIKSQYGKFTEFIIYTNLA